jgi:hypothetical protein
MKKTGSPKSRTSVPLKLDPTVGATTGLIDSADNFNNLKFKK